MSNEVNNKLKYYPVLDLVKFIAALLILFIHIFPEGSTTQSVGLDSSIPVLIGESFIYAILRPAVPIFFVISSFLLFKKINADPINKWKYIRHFCIRLLLLYLFWFITDIPLIVKDFTTFISTGDQYNLIRYIVVSIVKGVPRGFWFIVSLIVGVIITSFFNNKKSLIVITIIAGLMFIYGCFNSAYFGVFTKSNNPISQGIVTFGNYLELSYSFFEAFLFIVLGKIFATYGSANIKGNIILIVISFLLMVTELFLTLYFDLLVYPDAYFFLPVFIFFLFNKIITLDIENEKFILRVKKLKKVGSFSYLFHIQFFCYMHWILDSIGHNIFREHIGLLIFPYVICVLLCFVLQTLFENLSKYKYLRFLKYSY